MHLTYTYRLKLTEAQKSRIDGWAGVCRLVYNMALEIKIDAYKKGIPISFNDLGKQLKNLKDIPWIADVSADTLSLTVRKLQQSYDRFFKGGGFPKFKSKKEYPGLPLKPDRRYNTIRALSDDSFNLPKIGTVRVFKSRMPVGTIVSTFIVKKIDKYYLHISTEVEQRPLPTSDNQVGIDVGLSKFCVVSDGTFVDHPELLATSQKQLRVEQRKLARMKKGGNKRKKQIVVIGKLHLKVSRQRNDFLQKLSSKIIKENGTISVEKLNVAGMVKSNLAAKISDSGWGYFRQMLSYKANLYGREYHEVNARYTSQECFQCGHTEKGNRKSQSEFKCLKCGHEENADLNAANNILRRGQRLSSQSTDSSLRLGEVPVMDVRAR